MQPDAILFAFDYFYYRDKMNAAVHCAPVKFSPITERLAKELRMEHNVISPELDEILGKEEEEYDSPQTQAI